MKKQIALVAAAVFALGAGCGASVCDRAKSLPDTMNAKLTACTNVTFSSKLNDCDAKMKNCNGDDQAKMQKWFDCLEALPACTAGQEDAWTQSTIDCATKNLAGISQACQDGITGG